MVVCLGAVCLICGAVLGSLYAVTKKPIDRTRDAAEKEAVGKVLPDGGELSAPEKVGKDGIVEYYVQTRDGAAAAYAVKSSTAGFGGELVLMVGVLPDGTVNNTTVVEHSETPGLGAKCTDENSHFREQWKGFGPDRELAVGKDGGDVDAITASTITSRAYTAAVKQAVDFVKSLGK